MIDKLYSFFMRVLSAINPLNALRRRAWNDGVDCGVALGQRQALTTLLEQRIMLVNAGSSVGSSIKLYVDPGSVTDIDEVLNYDPSGAPSRLTRPRD